MTNNTIWALGRKLTFLVPLFLLGSCAAQDDVTDAPQTGHGTLAVNEVTTFTGGTSTRADATPTVATPPAGSSIGVFRQADSYYLTAINNVKYTLGADGKWAVATTGTDILLGAKDSRALLYAYYPNSGKIAVAADNTTVTLGNRAYDADYDLAYMGAGNAMATDAGGLVYNFHPGVKFQMKRAYTQLAVSLTRGDDYGGTGAVTAVSLKLNGGGKLYSSGTQNIATGVYTAGTADVDKITYTIPANTKVTTTAKTATFAQLLPPGKNGAISNLTLTVTVDGVTTNTTISTADLAMEVGKRYLVKATLNYYGLAASIKTTDWDSQTAWNEEAEFVPVILWIEVGGYKWAVSNVVVTKQSDNTFKCEFAEEAYYYSYIWNGSDYLCWNTLDPETYNVTQTEWSDSRDPCQNIGMEWSTPTDIQFQALVDAGSVWGTWTKADNKTTINGRYFGITTQPSVIDQKKYLFLPAAGLRFNGSTSMMYDGTGGRYWSKSPVEGGGYKSYLTFGNGNTCSVATNGTCVNGYTIRCVRNR